MIRTPLSTVIGGAFWTPEATVVGGTRPSFETVVKKLFANNEQGFFYDPNDLSTMFQDAAGTIPVTAAGQPVGLILDKSKEVLSTEKVVNPDFDSDTAWTKAATVTISNGSAILNGAIGNPVLSQNVGLTAGKWYEVTINVTEVTSGVSTFIIYGTGGNDTIFSISSAGIYKAMTRARSDATGLIGFSALLTSVKLSSVSVKELAGNHAYQTTSASRPILQQNATTGANYLEFDGSDDFLRTNNIDFTATDKVSLFAGVRKLSDANRAVLVELGTNGVNAFLIQAPTVAGGVNFAFTSGASLLKSDSVGNMVAPISAVLTAKADIQSSYVALIANGGINTPVISDQGIGNYQNAPIYIGRRAGTTLAFNGHLYSLIGIGRLTSDSEIAAIEKELAKRTGVSLNV